MPRLSRLAAVVLVVLAGAGASACGGSGEGSGSRSAPARFTAQITLPAPATTGTMSLEEAIAERRSSRAFGTEPLALATLGQLLWAGQGITGPGGKRAAPSAGALYPLELYVVTSTQVMRYVPQGNRLEVREARGVRARLEDAAYGQAPLRAAPDVIVVAATPERTRARYGSQAARFVDLEAGHVGENILLQATASGLAAVPIGSFDPASAAGALALAPDETVVYLIPVGPRP